VLTLQNFITKVGHLLHNLAHTMKLVILCCLLALAGLSQAAPQELINQPQAVESNDQACDYCEQLVNKFLNKDTLHGILHKIDKYCDYLPGEFGQQCKNLVDQYGEQIINEILSKYSAKTICTDIVHVCHAKKVFFVNGIMPVSAPKQQDPCAMCKQVVGQFLNKNTLEQLLHKVESFCDKLPGGFAAQCKQIVDQYGEQLINQILATYTPEKVCKDIFHVCSYEKDEKQQDPCAMCKQVVGQFLNKNTLEQILHKIDSLCDKLPGGFAAQCKQIVDQYGEQLINQILATYTPEKVCKDIFHVCSYEEKEVVSRTIPMLILANRPQYLPFKKNQQLCDTCTNVGKQLLNKDTLNALLERAEEFCDRLPGWIGEQCHKVLESEGHKVIDELVTKFTPDKVCKDILHFC